MKNFVFLHTDFFIMRNLFLLLTFFSIFVIKGHTAVEYPDSIDSCNVKHFEMIDNVIQFGKKYIGTPYRYGGKSDKGFDCSGFVHFIFEPYGFNLPYSSRGYSLVGEEIKAEEARKGDFALFKGRNAAGTTIGHVALVIDVDENGSIYILHATIHKGVTIDNMSTQDYYIRRYLSMRRISPDCSQSVLLKENVTIPAAAE